MGSTWSKSSFSYSSPSTSQVQIKDVLALCEDGDLLLAREKLAHSALRVGVEFVVARDIERMQRGQFPAQRVTSLPCSLVILMCLAWTSCELLLRHEGALYVVSVGVNGLQLVLFEERVASKKPQIHDRFAIRRLGHVVRSEAVSADLRELTAQIASVTPLAWQTLLFPTVNTKMSPRYPRQPSVDREAVTDALKELPPLIRRLLKRVMELFYQRLNHDDTKTTSKPNQPPEPLNTNSSKDKNLETSDKDIGAIWSIALDDLGVAEFTARLSAAFVAAVYEYVHLVDPIGVFSNVPLAPTAFCSSCNGKERLIFTPPTAFGSEMILTHSTEQNT